MTAMRRSSRLTSSSVHGHGPRRARTARALGALTVVLAFLGVGMASARSTGAATAPAADDTTTTAAPTTTTTTVAPTTTTSTAPRRTGPIRVAFLGDSVAWTTASAVAPTVAARANLVTVLNDGIWGCGVVRGTPFRYFGSTLKVLPNDCDHWPAQWRAAMDRQRPEVAVVVTGRWELMDRVHDGRWTHVGDPVFDAYLGRELDEAIAAAGSRGARVVVTTTPYYRRGNAPGGGTWPEDVPARVDLVNRLLRQAVARHPGVGLVDLGGHLSPGGKLAMRIDGVRIRTDGVHIAASAGPWLAPWLFPTIRAAAGY
jgi:hypothetical protein